jgi:Adenylate and Guanylate cyclase catalytic domain
MDFLALKFKIFKIETIGDAYVCCSGLPAPDEHHAENVANFAIAVTHCCKQVLLPVSAAPIQLRIGIHTGPVASGVVGTTNPRYCVFGDTMNTCSRHESTGLPGRVHCSQTTAERLRNSESYSIMERGMVEMKGKGEQLTYWLRGSQRNKLANEQALKQLDLEVNELLAKTDFDKFDGVDSYKAAEKAPIMPETSAVPGGFMSAMQRAAVDMYIEEEVSRRLQESTVCEDRMNLDHSEDTGLLREANTIEPEKRQAPACEQAPTNVCLKEKKAGRSKRTWRLRNLRFIYV